MKKTLIFAVMVVLLSMVCAYANSVPIDVTAKVPDGTPEIIVKLYSLTDPNPPNPWPPNGTPAEAMDFGELTHFDDQGNDVGQWYSKKYFFAGIFPVSFGNKYQVTSTLTNLVGEGNQLPENSFGMVTQYAADDEWTPGNPQGNLISGETFWTQGKGAPHTNVWFFRSNTARNRILRVFYSIPRLGEGGYPPWPYYNQIPLDQPAGDYTGTATITITEI